MRGNRVSHFIDNGDLQGVTYQCIVLTGRGMREDIERSRVGGFASHLAKLGRRAGLGSGLGQRKVK